MALASRPYRDARDIARMKAITGRTFPRDRGDVPFGGLEWVVFGPHGFPPSEIVELWEDDRGDLGAWLILGSEDGFEYHVTPARRATGLEEEVIAHGERRLSDWRAAHGLGDRCVVECWLEDHARIAILKNRGYRPSDAGAVLFSRSLQTALAPPSPPAGWTVRGMTEVDIEGRAKTQFEAFSPGSKTTPATWARMMSQAPGYDCDLDSIAVRDSDGVVGAGALMWVDEGGSMGEFEPVGTRPEFQRLGLGKAVLWRGLATMQQRGVRAAYVRTNATNARAIAAYESVGFEICARAVEYVLRE
jgi:ribosomal protein S18 acetylase RimI-like enzyme